MQATADKVKSMKRSPSHEAAIEENKALRSKISKLGKLNALAEDAGNFLESLNSKAEVTLSPRPASQKSHSFRPCEDGRRHHHTESFKRDNRDRGDCGGKTVHSSPRTTEGLPVPMRKTLSPL